MSSKPSWNANPRNNAKRINAYSNPWVQEVIYAPEWEQKPNNSTKPYMKCWECHSHPCKCGHVEYLKSKRKYSSGYSGILILIYIVITVIVYLKIGVNI